MDQGGKTHFIPHHVPNQIARCSGGVCDVTSNQKHLGGTELLSTSHSLSRRGATTTTASTTPYNSTIAAPQPTPPRILPRRSPRDNERDSEEMRARRSGDRPRSTCLERMWRDVRASTTSPRHLRLIKYHEFMTFITFHEWLSPIGTGVVDGFAPTSERRSRSSPGLVYSHCQGITGCVVLVHRLVLSTTQMNVQSGTWQAVQLCINSWWLARNLC